MYIMYWLVLLQCSYMIFTLSEIKSKIDFFMAATLHQMEILYILMHRFAHISQSLSFTSLVSLETFERSIFLTTG